MIYGDQSSVFFVLVMTTISAFVIITNLLLLKKCSRHFEASMQTFYWLIMQFQ